KNTEVFTIHNHDNSIQFIPEARQSLTGTKLLLHNQLNTAGIYFVSANKKQQLAFALNYSRKESSLNVLTTNEVKQIFEQAGANVQIVAGNPEQVGNAIKQSFTGTPLWQWFIALALIFLIIEIALIRFLN